MTATVTPARPDASGGPEGFRPLLRSEWTKFRTVRGWVIAVIVAALVTVLLGVWGGARSQNGCPYGPCHFTVPTGPGGEAVTDTYYFVHRPLTAQASITVRVTALTESLATALTPQGPGRTQPVLVPWSKAGLLISAGGAQGSPYAAVLVTADHGVRMQWDYTGDTAGLAGTVSAAAPRWLRLTRSGDVITGYDSADGARWTAIGRVTLPGLAATAQAGLFATSPDDIQPVSQSLGSGTADGGSTQATATFDHVTAVGAEPGGDWAGTAVNGGPNSISYPSGIQSGYHRSGGTFTVTGSGDIAPGVTGTQPADFLLDGLFIGLIALIVVGALFVTAEYRRGLIRVTLAASPRRGRLLAAKAVVLGTVAFAAGLAGSAGAIALGLPLLRANGNSMWPMTTFTEVRLIGGTALLVAVLTVFALGVGAIVRHGAAAVTVVITAVILPYVLTAAFPVLPAGAAQWVLRVTPAAGFAIKQVIPAYPQVIGSYVPSQDYFPLAPWAGLVVTCGWAVVTLAVAVFLLRRRDA
jgi:ABC-type transport system involved in multi-copper enzyme maturation permease subunit